MVLLGEFATDIPRAWLLKINDLQNSEFPIFLSLRASNQMVGGSTTSRQRSWTPERSDGGPEGTRAPARAIRPGALKNFQRGQILPKSCVITQWAIICNPQRDRVGSRSARSDLLEPVVPAVQGQVATHGNPRDVQESQFGFRYFQRNSPQADVDGVLDAAPQHLLVTLV